MRRKRYGVAAKECDERSDPCAPRKGSGEADLRVQSVTVVAARKVVQQTDDALDAVVTSAGKGTFLIRRRKEHLSSPCPLLCYEVRRIDGGAHQGLHDRPADNADHLQSGYVL
jgi:hypothetical protein